MPSEHAFAVLPQNLRAAIRICAVKRMRHYLPAPVDTDAIDDPHCPLPANTHSSDHPKSPAAYLQQFTSLAKPPHLRPPASAVAPRFRSWEAFGRRPAPAAISSLPASETLHRSGHSAKAVAAITWPSSR